MVLMTVMSRWNKGLNCQVSYRHVSVPFRSELMIGTGYLQLNLSAKKIFYNSCKKENGVIIRIAV